MGQNSGISPGVNEKPDNPAAFPATYDGTGSTDPGMTLRDYFAAKALAGLLASGEECYSGENPDWPIGAAMDAYTVADAMLKARAAK